MNLQRELVLLQKERYLAKYRKIMVFSTCGAPQTLILWLKTLHLDCLCLLPTRHVLNDYLLLVRFCSDCEKKRRKHGSTHTWTWKDSFLGFLSWFLFRSITRPTYYYFYYLLAREGRVSRAICFYNHVTTLADRGVILSYRIIMLQQLRK